MELRRIYEKFEEDLLQALPADESDFISLLEKENIIGAEARKKMSVFNRTKIVRAVAIMEEIEKSLSISDEKLKKLATVMKKYDDLNPSAERIKLKPLADKIENHIDPGIAIIILLEKLLKYVYMYIHMFISIICTYVC